MNSATIVNIIRIVLGPTCLMVGLAGCAGDSTGVVVRMGSIEVTTTTTGSDIALGYIVCVQECFMAAPNGTVTLGVPAGQQVVELQTRVDNCSVQGANPRTVTVTAAQAVQTTFAVTCAAVTGTIEVTTSTTGADSTPYIYWLELDGWGRTHIGTGSRVVYQSIRAGTHTVALRGLPPNCTIGDVNPRSVTFAPAETAGVAFSIGCTAPVGNKLAMAHLDIFSIHADATGFANLTRNGATNRQPAWDPTGTRIAFVSSSDIQVMNADGSHPIPLTATPALEERFPMWSPDGTRIAFLESTATGAWFLSIMDADGSHPLRLATSSDTRPAWSPDGTKIVFSRQDGDNWDIYRVGADGTGLTNLTNSPAADLDPVWSPDGSQIAFSSDRSGDREIYVVRVDGAGLVRLTHAPGLDDQPQWSPDGSRIAFRRWGVTGGIYVIGPTGSNEVRIAMWSYTGPRWSPDGARIAFVTLEPFVTPFGELYDIIHVFMVVVDGGGETNSWTFVAAYGDAEIEWSPRR